MLHHCSPGEFVHEGLVLPPSLVALWKRVESPCSSICTAAFKFFSHTSDMLRWLLFFGIVGMNLFALLRLVGLGIRGGCLCFDCVYENLLLLC